MRVKEFLLNEVIKLLEMNRYEFFIYGKCFDIVAKKENRWLIKVLYNLDSLEENEAKNIRVFSYFMSCFPFIVSEVSNEKKLEDGVIYFRYNIYSGNLNTFSQIIKEGNFKSFAIKGKHIVKIDTQKLKKLREEKKISLGKLSSYLKISKKSLYEIEKNISYPTKETAIKLEKFFNTSLILENQFKIPTKEILKPKTIIEKRISYSLEKIGIENSSLDININLVGKSSERIIVLSRKINREEEEKAYNISKLLETLAFYIGKENTSIIPKIDIDKIEKIESIEELKEIVEY
ncbi:MAG: helix-turn-helix domain-containing protein [Candidatus Aenigmatarchaeota archaeon]